jgi:hypothetical protein
MTKYHGNLTKALAHWRGVEPGPGFEDGVWRRIRAEAPSRATNGLDAWWTWLMAQPVYANAAMLCVGAAFGLAVLFAFVDPTVATGTDEFNIFRAGSVSGSYAQMMNGAAL